MLNCWYNRAVRQTVRLQRCSRFVHRQILPMDRVAAGLAAQSKGA